MDNDEELRIAFSAFDTDKNGSISIAELKKMMSKLDHALTKEEVEGLIKDIDLNKDGEVSSFLCATPLSYFVFVCACLKLSEPWCNRFY